MIPRLQEALHSLAARTVGHIVPSLTDPYAAADAGLIASLLVAVAQEAERGVAVRLADIAEVRPIFRDGHEALGDGALATRLRALLDRSPEDFTLSVLDEEHSAWLEALADLHEAVAGPAEGVDAAEAARIDAAIWRFLRGHTERHAFELPL